MLASISIKAKDRLEAGSFGTWKMKIAIDQFFISSGGSIKIGYDLRCGIPSDAHCQGVNPEEENYVFCNVSSETKVRISGYDVHHYDQKAKAGTKDRFVSESYFWRDVIGFDVNLNMQICKITVEEGKLEKGDILEVIFGDTSRGSPGMRLPLHSRKKWNFWVVGERKPNAPMEFLGKESLTVSPGQAERLKFTVPSLIKEREKFIAHSIAFDSGCNPVNRTNKFSYEGSKGIKKEAPQEFSISSDGIYRLKVKDKDTHLEAQSNPIWCSDSEPEYRLYWGDIHGHTNYSDGGSSGLDEYYQWARDIMKLNFSAVSDHDFGIALEPREKKWREIVESANRFNKKRNFVTFIGWEISHVGILTNTVYGHKNIYFSSDNAPFFNSSPYGKERVRIDYQHMEELWEFLKEYQFIVIPRHTAKRGGPGGMGTDWDKFNPQYERLVEIYSLWGSSEGENFSFAVDNLQKYRTVQSALARGYRLGFTGGTDTHNARPGGFNELVFRQKKPGLTAVWAKELSREGIFEALWERRCYAIRGERIILDMRLNRYPMGAELSIKDIKSIKIEIRASGTESLSVELLRNNQVVSFWKDMGEDVNLYFEDASFYQYYKENKLVWYYVRLNQSNGSMAWSSPIWISE